MIRANILVAFGDTHGFQVQAIPMPEIGPRQLRVKVFATSINPLDYQIWRGDYRSLVSLPTIIGHDISGVVEKVSPDVTEFSIGDEVYYVPKIFGGHGSYAEYHVVDADLVASKPKGLSHLAAGVLPLVAGTVWEALVTRSQLKRGETILVHGGAGGVGHVAIQVAKALGAHVLTTVRERDQDFVKALGANAAIDFVKQDYRIAVRELTNGQGVDVVLDTIGNRTLSESPNILAPLGRVVSIVDTSIEQNLIDAWGVNASYHFVFTRQNRDKLTQISELVNQGKLNPQISTVFDFEEIESALNLLKLGGVRGKIAIRVDKSL